MVLFSFSPREYRIGQHCVSVPDPGRQKIIQNKSEENSCFEVLDVLLGGLEASPAA
jgi:hypothetical protein